MPVTKLQKIAVDQIDKAVEEMYGFHLSTYSFKEYIDSLKTMPNPAEAFELIKNRIDEDIQKINSSVTRSSIILRVNWEALKESIQ